MISVRIGGDWLPRIGTVSDLTFTSRWPGGCWAASWSMLPNLRHPLLRAGKDVDIYDAATLSWSGRLADPDIAGGAYTAVGWGQVADTTPALSSSGIAANRPGAAITAAIARGLPWYGTNTFPSFPNDLVTNAREGLRSLSGLLNDACNETGQQWGVGPDRICRMLPNPTTPQWQVLPGIVGDLGTADDTYASQLVGRYLDSGTSAYATVVVTDPNPRGGWAELVVDLTPRGSISSTTATNVLTNMIARGKNKLRWVNAVDVTANQIRHIGGQRAPLSQVQAGQMVRLLGVTDPNTGFPYVDWVIGEATYKVADQVLTITPIDVATRTLRTAIERAGGQVVDLAG